MGFPVRANGWRPEQLEQILDRCDLWAPPVDEPLAVFDHEGRRDIDSEA
jgi:hypothetical protein